MERQVVDLEGWGRRSAYDFFRGLAQPHFSLCAGVDATELIERGKPAGVSVFRAVLWSLVEAANAVEELRTRFAGDEVYVHAEVHPSVTVPRDGGGFAFCSLRHHPEWARFDVEGGAAIAAAKASGALEETAEGDGWLYMSCLPWVHFSAMTNPTAGPDDCVPRITWGKFQRREGRWEVPVAVQVHHALVDGAHLGRFYAEARARLAQFGEEP